MQIPSASQFIGQTRATLAPALSSLKSYGNDLIGKVSKVALSILSSLKSCLAYSTSKGLSFFQTYKKETLLLASGLALGTLILSVWNKAFHATSQNGANL